MKVLFVNHLVDPEKGGGTAERTMQLADNLSHLGCICSILALNIGDICSVRSNFSSVHLHLLGCINERFYIPKASLRVIEDIVSQYDVIHLSGNWTFLNFLTYLSCCKLSKPYIFCPAGAYGIFGRSVFFKKVYNAFIGSRILKNSTFSVAITNDEAVLLEKSGLPGSRVFTIPNGVSSKSFIEADNYLSNKMTCDFLNFKDRPYILFLGRLAFVKGVDLLIKAFSNISRNYKDYQLVIAGPDGGMLADLKILVSSLGLDDRVHFPGFLNKEQKYLALNRAELLAIPSRSEAMSIVILEAGVSKCPVLYTKMCGLEFFTLNNAGYEVDVTVSSIADGLSYIIDNNVDSFNRSNNLVEIIKNDYLWSIQARKYLNLFSSAIN